MNVQGSACRFKKFVVGGLALVALASCTTLHSDRIFLHEAVSEESGILSVCFSEQKELPICNGDSIEKGCVSRGNYGENLSIDYSGHRILLRVEYKKGFESAGPLVFPLIPFRLKPRWPNRVLIWWAHDAVLTVAREKVLLELPDGKSLSALTPEQAKRGSDEFVFEFPNDEIPEILKLKIDGVTVNGRPQESRVVSLRSENSWNFEFFLLYPSSDWRYVTRAPCGSKNSAP